MSKRTYEMRLPGLCAWCGSAGVVTKYPIEIHIGNVHQSFPLPACRDCEAKLKKQARLREGYKSLLKKSRFIGVGIGFVLGVIVGIVLFSQLGYLSFGGIILGSVAIGVLVAIFGAYGGHIVGSIKYREHPGKKLRNEYKSYEMAWGGVRYAKFRFKNERFAKRFATLNPHLVKQE